jgi:hypothetical protein
MILFKVVTKKFVEDSVSQFQKFCVERSADAGIHATKQNVRSVL